MTSRHNIVKMQHDVDWNKFETHPEIDYVFIHYLVTFIMLKCFLIRKLFILILIGLYTLLLFPINLNGLICILFLVIIFIVDLYFNFMGVCDNWISICGHVTVIILCLLILNSIFIIHIPSNKCWCEHLKAGVTELKLKCFVDACSLGDKRVVTFYLPEIHGMFGMVPLNLMLEWNPTLSRLKTIKNVLEERLLHRLAFSVNHENIEDHIEKTA